VRVTIEDGKAVHARGDANHPLSRGYICPKGNGMPWSHYRTDRLNHAYVRGAESSIEHCISDMVEGVHRVVTRHGALAVGSYTGTGGGAGDMVTPTALFRLMNGLGSPQVYSGATVDNAPTWRASEIVTGYAAEVMLRWLPEDEKSKLVILVGCNPRVSHGYFTILTDPGRRIRRFQQRGGRVWVIDPRASETARRATGHIAPKPGTDAFILAWLLKEMLAAPPNPQLLAETVASADLDALRQVLQPLTRDIVVRETDMDGAELDALLAEVRAAGKIAVITGSGINFAAHALTSELLRWALLAVTGSLDMPGGMRFDAGYMSKYEDRAEWKPAPVEGLLAPGAASRPELYSICGQRPAAAIVDEIEAGTIKALLVSGGSPLTSFPETDRVRAALKSLDVLAVFDVVHTPLTEIATHVFPALGQLERAGLVAWNGRAAFTPAVLPPAPGRGFPWRAFGRIAKKFGLDVLDGHDPDTAEELDVLQSVVANARFDLPTLRAAGPAGVAMPMPTGWIYHALPERRWRIASPTLLNRVRGLLVAGAGPSNGLMLVNRRQVSHNGSTHCVDDYDRPLLLMSPADASARNIDDGDRVRIANSIGSALAVVKVTPEIRNGVVSLPHGWFDTNVAALISGTDGVDPLTSQPQMSGIAVTVVRANLPVANVA
jgi:anaerobic selenocysteine-containing dehydrogenase